MADPRVIIIGGGITGLTCAYRLRQARPDLDITVVEGTAKTGGPIETVVMGETNQYTLEQGPDNFITNKPFVLDLAKSLNLTERIVKIRPEGTGALVLSDGQ
ncbi:MAG: FAD-dependent oxidoreductase, partial [Candidatus Obscuribacter sp.]|nr:FAD-dependent oxidoreductase [Candidatus Obscuribacter sp.]